MIIVDGMLYVIYCRDCGAMSEERSYVWKSKEKWVPFMFCPACRKVICEECLDTMHWKECADKQRSAFPVFDWEIFE